MCARRRLPSAGARNLCATGLLEYGGEMATLDESMAIFRLKQKRAEVLSGLPVRYSWSGAPWRST